MCALQKTLLRVKRQGTDCDEIFTDHISNKGLVSQIFKELSNSVLKKQTTWKIQDQPIITQKHAN